MSRPEAPIKYRASCDGCYHAKLKCTKEKPTCPRCKHLGLACTYSPSQRTGKHRAAKSSAGSTTTTTATSTPPPSATAAASPSSPHALTWQPPASHASGMMPTETLAQPFEHTSFAPSHDSPLSFMDATMSDWSNTPVTLHDLDSNLLAPWRNYLPNVEQDEPVFHITDDLAAGFPAMTPPPTDRKYPFHAAIDSPLTPPCNCFNSITQALNDMHNQSRHQRSNPALEATLSKGKEVTARGEMLLNCSCTDDSSLIMLFAALIAKYLSLYAANPDSVSSPSSTASFTDTYSSPSTTSTSSRVTIGKYTMDVEDGERLRMEIILMELQKLNALLGKFRGKFSSVDVAYEGHTYETMLDFLKTRLKEAMNRLQRQKQRYQPSS